MDINTGSLSSSVANSSPNSPVTASDLDETVKAEEKSNKENVNTDTVSISEEAKARLAGNGGGNEPPK